MGLMLMIFTGSMIRIGVLFSRLSFLFFSSPDVWTGYLWMQWCMKL